MRAHKDGGSRCLVSHSSHGQCIKCAYCNDWIKPDDIGKNCPKYGQLSADYIELTGMLLQIKARKQAE